MLSSGLLLSVAFSLAVFRPHGSGGLCTRRARRPFLPGQVLALPAGRLRQAAACGSGLGGLLGALWPRVWPAVLVHGVLVRRLQGVRSLASVSPSG